MPSIFRTKLVLPFLFYEVIQEEGKDGLTRQVLDKAYQETFSKPLEDEMATEIIERLIDEAKQIKNAPEPGPRVQKQVFGTSLSNFIAGLQGDRLCLFLAEYDIVKARELYSSEDIHVVIAASREKSSFLAELSGIWYEAVLFGMGGHYKGNGPDDNVVDLSHDAKAALPRLKALGLA